MNKKILIGSIVAAAILLLIPSISAIQHKVVKDEILSEIQEVLDFKELIKFLDSGKLNRFKHLVLGLLVTMWMYFRLIRCQILAKNSYKITFEYDYDYEIHHPILFLRLLILLINTGLVVHFFQGLSDLLGWNWDIPI